MKTLIEARVEHEGRFPIRIVTPEGSVPLTLNEAKRFIHELVTAANIVERREESERKSREVFYMKDISHAQ